MLDLDAIARLALSLPGTREETKYGKRAWTVKGKTFVWERPFRKTDLERFGDQIPPAEPIIGLAVDDLTEKEVLLAQNHPGLFTIPHFDGYPAVLAELGSASWDVLTELIVDAWLAKAPANMAEAYLRELPDR